MKNLTRIRRFALLFLSLISLPAMADDHDYRKVNGRIVDLGPVHAWYSARKGERPMKHWKMCRMYQMYTYTVQADQCVIVGEDGLQMRVYLLHLDSPIRDPFVSLIDANQTIADLTQQVKNDEGVVNGLAGNSNRRFQADRDAAQHRLNDERPTLAEAINRRNYLLSPNGPIDVVKRIPFLAMDTGASTMIPGTGKSANYWDCGIKSKAPAPSPAPIATDKK